MFITINDDDDKQTGGRETGIANIQPKLKVTINNERTIMSEATQRITQTDAPVRVEFMGHALGLFGRILLAGLLSFLVIPAPWLAVWLNRWIVGNFRVSDGTKVAFTGQAGDIWFPIMAVQVLSLVGQSTGRTHGGADGHVSFIPFLLIPVSCFFSLLIVRWFWKNIQTDNGTKMSFEGKYLPYLGWTLFISVSVLTIIGWAWVLVAQMKWYCRNIKGDGFTVDFQGDGWNVLWRTFVFAISCILIIPIPWTSLWLMKWYLANITVRNTRQASIPQFGS
ncbi:MAG: DUF898 domain-containing protein [Chlorobiaceae bacterium]|nr:DUF898 domain-containing protein [Chlorobiaceae bacterium]